MARVGETIGTQYRSAIYVDGDDQRRAAETSRKMYQERLKAARFGEITTEIADAGPFYYAEDYHQQYLAKNVNGYNPAHATGVACPIRATGVKLGEPAERIQQVCCQRASANSRRFLPKRRPLDIVPGRPNPAAR